MSFTVNSIGAVRADADGYAVELKPQYRTALEGLEGFGHVQVIWWFDGCDDALSRSKRFEDKPYVNGPARLGTFATRSPQRPNPIAVSTAGVTYIDVERGILGLDWIDANDQSPVLDLKPYTPSADRVEAPVVPDWCAHWPGSLEASGAFNWEDEFNF